MRDDFLTINLMPFLKSANERLSDLSAARELVASAEDVLGGTPVIRGTRVPIYDVAASVAAGHPGDRILEAYPGLDAEKVRLAALDTETTPPRRRPRAAAGLPEGSVIISDRRSPRRRKAG